MSLMNLWRSKKNDEIIKFIMKKIQKKMELKGIRVICDPNFKSRNIGEKGLVGTIVNQVIIVFLSVLLNDAIFYFIFRRVGSKMERLLASS